MDSLTSINFSQFSDRETREKYEDIAVMLSSVGIAESIPVLGEIQMGLQFLDSIDPYGYNQAFTRDTLTKIFSSQFDKINQVQTAISDCLDSKDVNSDSCKTAGITGDFLTQYSGLDPTIQEKVKKSMTSWATPYSPDTNLSKLALCTYATDPTRMQNCPDSVYQQAYTDFYNQNLSAYSPDAAKARQAAIDALEQQLEGQGESEPQTTNWTFIGIGLILLWIILFILLKEK